MFLCVNNIQEMKRPLYSKKVFSLTKSNSESLQKTSLTDHYLWNGPPEWAPEKWSRFFKLPEPLRKKCILMLWERLLEGKHLSVCVCGGGKNGTVWTGFSISIGLFRSIQYIENSDIVHHANICKMVWKQVETTLRWCWYCYLENVTLIIRQITYKVHIVYTNGLFAPLG